MKRPNIAFSSGDGKRDVTKFFALPMNISSEEISEIN
jgi:hypothetical protein